ncbi:MAG: mannose-1-phosphate guanylyltransferase [Deltaproteobacteria bacterium]|nr:mannose-1-phosphate guanylyltransferase [Deltaproteobacteria bacterium]
MGKKPEVYVAIMAGGGGTRFWPWSREERPKQILPIISNRSMIWETVERIRSFTSSGKIFIITSRSQAKELQREAPQIPQSNLLLEPLGKNTAPCLCLAALYIQKLNPEAIMVVLPADHFIADRRGFLRTLKAAVGFTAKRNFLMTLGIPPTEPETGYGYIQKGETLGKVKGISVFKAKAFREKPTRAKARAYLRTGKYLWNSGMFIWKVGVFLAALEKYLPQLYEEMRPLQNHLGTARGEKLLEKVYARCQPVSVDYGIMEKAENVALIEAQFHWDDVGSWAALCKILPKDEKGNALVAGKQAKLGKILAIDSAGCLIRGEEKLIAVIGMKGTVVVEAGNAFLVCPRDRAQDIRRVIEELKNRGWTGYL